ncbi:MAG: radical SAM protein [Promethearchaeota archaeon]
MPVGLPPEQIVIRPPVEAFSVLIPVTGGCAWNRCRFCGVYKGVQEFAVRPLEEVKRDVDAHAEAFPGARWAFLAGGNPTAAPTDYLVEVIRHVRSRFPRLERLSSYGKVLDLLVKKPAEVRALADAGLTTLYVGLESGSDRVLRSMRKGHTKRGFVEATRRALDAGLYLSAYVILGLGGRELSEEHCRETARAITEAKPSAVRFRTLNVMRNSPLWEDYQAGRFELLRPVEMLREEHDVIAQLGDDVHCAAFNDHVSNFCNLETDDVGRDRKAFLAALREAMNDPRVRRLGPVNRQVL